MSLREAPIRDRTIMVAERRGLRHCNASPIEMRAIALGDLGSRRSHLPCRDRSDATALASWVQSAPAATAPARISRAARRSPTEQSTDPFHRPFVRNNIEPFPCPVSRSRCRHYIELTKPRITWLILMSTGVGYYFGHQTPWVGCRLGTAAALDRWAHCFRHRGAQPMVERAWTVLMRRTASRPPSDGPYAAAPALWLELL